MIPVTLWYLWDGEQFVFNHLENRHNLLGRPTAISLEQHKAWKGRIWRPHHAYLNDEFKVVEMP